MSCANATLSVVAMICLGGMVVGCDFGTAAVEHPEGDEAWEMAFAVDYDEQQVVARVNGQGITGDDLKEYWRLHPELSAPEVVDQLVEQQILALEARERGYHEYPEVSFARKQGMVSALLADEVEARAEPDLSRRDEMLEQVTQMRRVPEGLRVTHLVVLVPREMENDEGSTERLSGEQRDEVFDTARQIVGDVQQWLDGRVDDDALREAAAQFHDRAAEEGLEIIVEPHMLFPRAGEDFHAEHLPGRWTRVVSDFAKGAETVAGEDQLGSLSEPVRTDFGWHLIRVIEVMEERPADRDAVEEYVDYELRVRAQREKFHERVEEWAKELEASVYPDRLGSVFDGNGR